jgi:hypothetical protein
MDKINSTKVFNKIRDKEIIELKKEKGKNIKDLIKLNLFGIVYEFFI